MGSLAYIAPWVLASVSIGIAVGVTVGRSLSSDSEPATAPQDSQAVLEMLAELLGAAEQIANNVESHNTRIQENAEQVNGLQVTGEMETIKRTLLHHVTSLLASNTRLQEDLVCTRYRLEEQAEEIDHVRQEARSDDLTGVANRKAFDEKLHLLMDGWRRQQTPFVLILADLDLFKRVNDAHGHPVGDRVLRAAGDGLKQLARDGDFVGRYGGDEFAILLPHTGLEVGMEIAKALDRGIADKAYCVAVRGGEVSISFSMGVAVPCEGDTDESIVRHADQAMYRSKRAGGNHVFHYQAEDDLPADDSEPIVVVETNNPFQVVQAVPDSDRCGSVGYASAIPFNMLSHWLG
jgi:diguanylate cyclase